MLFGRAEAAGRGFVRLDVLANDNTGFNRPETRVEPGQPANGALSWLGGGLFEYQPDPGFKGVDTFTYRVRDRTGASNLATARILVAAVPLAPAVGRLTVYRPDMPSLLIDPQPIPRPRLGPLNAGIRINGDDDNHNGVPESAEPAGVSVAGRTTWCGWTWRSTCPG